MDDKNKKPEEYVERIRKDSFTDFLVSKQYKELVDTCDDLMNRKKMGGNDFTNIDKALKILCEKKIPNYLNYTMNRLGGGDKKDALSPKDETKKKFYKKYPSDRKGWGLLISKWFDSTCNTVPDNDPLTAMSKLLGWLANDGSTTYFPAAKLREAVRMAITESLYLDLKKAILANLKVNGSPLAQELPKLAEKLTDNETESYLKNVLEKRFDKLYNLVKKKIPKSCIELHKNDLISVAEDWGKILSKDTEKKIKLKINLIPAATSDPKQMFTLVES